MPKHTIQEAADLLSQAAPALNPEMYRRYEHELHQAEQEALGIAHDYMDQRAEDLAELRDELLMEACEVRDAYAALIREGEAGELSAKEFHRRSEELDQRKRKLNRQRQELDHAIGTVERIEEDPVGWVDQTFYGRYPQLTPTFSF